MAHDCGGTAPSRLRVSISIGQGNSLTVKEKRFFYPLLKIICVPSSHPLKPKGFRFRGIADGEQVWIESAAGRRISGKVCITEGIHPV